MRKIEARSHTLQQLLSNTRYGVDYYQREYGWGRKQLQELLDDLATQFSRSHQPGVPRSAVASYGPYFLGSIVVSRREGVEFLVDGQQRLTTLGLLLVYLSRRPEVHPDDRPTITGLVYSRRMGENAYTLQVEERRAVLDHLARSDSDPADFDLTDAPAPVRTMMERYREMDDLFPTDLEGDALPYFVDWLLNRVFLVKIEADNDEDAYTIFETMNDRGLPLSPTDMLKGYLLSNVKNETKRASLNDRWRGRVDELGVLDRDAPQDCVKAWLRGRYAITIREGQGDPGDFDRIGSEFHRWVAACAMGESDGGVNLGLRSSDDFARWIERDFDFYARRYAHVLEFSWRRTADLPEIAYNFQSNITLQPMVLLGAIEPGETESEIRRKWRVLATALDIWVHRRVWSGQAVDQRVAKKSLFQWLPLVREGSAAEIAARLRERVGEGEEAFPEWFALHQQNRRRVHRVLARLTDYVETGCGMASKYDEYVSGPQHNPYEVEHVWANKPERHADEFASAGEFREYRNRIGGLLLLPKKFNASYGALPYSEKVGPYFGQNALAKTMSPQAYAKDPGFAAFRERTGLAFRPFETFRKADLDERGRLLSEIAQRVWSADRITEAAKG